MRQAYLLILSTFLLFAFIGCSDDSGSNSTSASGLVGTWDMAKFEYKSKANPSLTEDLVQSGMNLSLTIKSNGDYTGSGNYLGFPYSFSGNMNEDGDSIDDGDPNTTITRSGNTLTIVDNDDSWDFGNGDEPATSTQVFEKQ